LTPQPPETFWLSKKYRIVMTILICAILVVAIFAGISFLGIKPSSNGNNENGNTTPTKVVLNIDCSATDGNWIRDATTNLPDYESTVSYSVSNSGNLDATNVSISISIDGNPYSTNVIPLIAVSDSYSSSFSYSTPYDQANNVLIIASCQGSSDSYTLSIGSIFPSSPYAFGGFSQTIAELFVTPHEQNLMAMKNSILNSKFILDADWTALWSWVGGHITYENEDSANYHWQFPKDTLQLKYGMCADYSTLLVSLYRDGVFGPYDAYVVLGANQNGKGHAWVIVRLPILGWYTLDPQENGGFLLNLVQNPFVVSGYTGQYEFNDQQFITIK
jgi:hypothetical protein